MFFFGKKTTELPIEFGEFPVYTGKIKKGPIRTEKPEYTRITFYIKGGIEEYKNKLLMAGYTQKSEVRFDRGINAKSYIILEKDFMRYKLAFHKKK